jgi:hypothetical protein
MDLYLTPVKIRGRKRKQSELFGTRVPSSPATLTPSSTPAKRPRTSKLSKRKKKAVFAMPTLQGLPQELLEMIFLYSMNTALPRSSPSLGRKLSSRAVTLEFTMRVFFHTVDHETNYRDRKKTSDPVAQSDVLSCRFFTWDFFLAYVQKAHDTMVTLRGKAWERTGVEVPGVRHFEGLWPFKFTTIPYLSFAEGFHIPERLLHRPWAHDKASLLYVLVSLNGEIDWKGSMAGEAAKLGIREAIKEKNEQAVAALAVLLGVPKAIDTSMLRYAVIDCGCDVNIVRHLLFNAQILAQETSKDLLNFLDTRLWAWADANGSKGEVLKHMLRKADAFELEFYFEEDTDWTKIVSFPYGGSKFDTRTTLDIVTRELLTNLYRTYGRKITRPMRRRVTDDTEHVE